MEERSFHPLDYVSVIRRRKWWFIVPLVLCILGGAVLSLILPKEYKSVAEIGVAAPTLSPELMRGVSSMDNEERRRAISQQLLSPTVLERVVREEEINPGSPVADTAAWLRGVVEQHIDVPKPIGQTGNDQRTLERIRLGYVDPNPQRAQQIANRLANVFVEENSKLRTVRAENTAAVLEQQMNESQDRLSRLQADLRRQKEANIGKLPNQENANLQALNNLNSRIENLSMQLSTEQNRITQLDSLIDDMRRSPLAMTINPAVSPAAAEMMAAQSRINSLTQQLAQNRAMGYTEEHPDIRRIHRELETARKEYDAARKPAGGSRDDLLNADPIYKARLLERDLAQRRVNELRRQLNAATSQIAVLQGRIESAPMVEQALASLTQEIELEKKRYEELSGNHRRAVTNEEIARKQGVERFTVLYPATFPGAPESPKPMRIMLMSLALGLMLGAGLVVAREFMDRSVHDARSLQSEFEIPVLGEIPRIPRVTYEGARN